MDLAWLSFRVRWDGVVVAEKIGRDAVNRSWCVFILVALVFFAGVVALVSSGTRGS